MAGLGRDTFGCAGSGMVPGLSTLSCARHPRHVEELAGTSLVYLKGGSMIDNDSSSASTNNTSSDTSADTSTRAADSTIHQDFHWVDGELQGSLYGNILETTLDVSAGIHACLQIVYASTLERAANEDADADTPATPVVGVVQADQLMRLAIASAGLLRDEARRQVEDLAEAA